MASKVTFSRLLNYDIKNSILQNRWRWIGAGALFIFLSHMITTDFQLIGKNPGISGIFLYLWKGNAPYIRTENSQFELPLLWFLYHTYFFYLIGDYPVKDLRGYGRQVFLQISNRKKWWLSKCVWVTISAVLYEALFLSVCFIYLAATNHELYVETSVVCQVIGLKSGMSIVWGILVYLGMMIWIGWFQFFLSLSIRPVLAVLVTLILMIGACYFYTPLFIGNFMMLARTCEINGNAMFLLWGGIALTMLSVALIWCGTNFIKKYELMK